MSRAGGLLVIGTSGLRISKEERSVLRSVQPGGVILFARNVESVDQVREWSRDVKRAAPQALLLVDAEGGRVDRLRALFGSAPSAARLASEPPAQARRAGRWVGSAIRAAGLDIDLAPVVDLDHGAADNALDGRYLGSDPRRVSARGSTFLQGLRAAGVLGCAKHFPGLGGATRDTHHAVAEVGLDLAALEREGEPFRRLLRDGFERPSETAVLVSHAIYPALDGTRLPATLSAPITTRLLRRGYGFRGVVFTDDLEMKALAPWGGLAERCEASLVAGCDALLVCSKWQEAPAIARRLSGAALRSRCAQALTRLERYRQAAWKAQRRAGAAPSPDEIRRALARWVP